MLLYANAKINWCLSVFSKRADGYHELDMLTQPIELSDIVCLRESETITLQLTGDQTIPSDHNNLAFKSAQLLQSVYGVQKGVAIELTKRIPSGAGLGGGSADAAAVMKGLNSLWDLSLSDTALQEMSLALGADIPLCLQGGLLRVQGIGEKLTAMPNAQSVPLVIVKPERSLPTASVYMAYDKLEPKPPNPSVDLAIKALSSHQISAFAATIGNALQSPAVSLLPEISVCIQTLEALGAIKAQMTGSGSAVFGIFPSFAEAQKAYAHCASLWKQTFLTKTI